MGIGLTGVGVLFDQGSVPLGRMHAQDIAGIGCEFPGQSSSPSPFSAIRSAWLARSMSLGVGWYP